MGAPRIDLTRMVFGKLTVLGPAPDRYNGHQWVTVWRIRCACGSPEKAVDGTSLRRGATKSCGLCLPNPIKRTHGLSKTPEYKVWKGMISRCYNPKDKDFHRYGAKGVRVCDRWRGDFLAFWEDMGPRDSPKHEIDRCPDKRGNYEPTNTRWATQLQNQRNRTDNHLVPYQGEMIPISEAAERSGLPENTIYSRLRRKWSPERAVSTPVLRASKSVHPPSLPIITPPPPRIRVRSTVISPPPRIRIRSVPVCTQLQTPA